MKMKVTRTKSETTKDQLLAMSDTERGGLTGSTSEKKAKGRGEETRIW